MKAALFVSAVLVFILSATFSAQAECGSCSPIQARGSPAPQCPDGVCATINEHFQTSSLKSPGGSSITTEGLKALLQSKVPLTILDARSGIFDDRRRIPGAKALNAESKVSEIVKILPEKESLIVTYCANLKCPASHNLSERLKSLGYKNVLEYPEGIAGWIKSGHEVETVSRK
ncbi:MAG TPA: rhodanese-like domain-containing protein [Candidatus Ozemobacteraceae bacterium]|nr:rhodanese-like domain-containing protein [Candidatus Ozemobacteraceae bacterium]